MAVITLTSCQKIPAHAITSIMQDILSPKNTEQLAQFLKGAASGRMQELQMPNKRNVIYESGSPRNLARNEVIQEVMKPRTAAVQKAMPSKVVMQRPNEVISPKNAVVQNTMPNTQVVQKQNEFIMPMNIVMQKANEATPKNIVIKKPEVTKRVLVQKPEVSNRRILVQKGNEIPMLRSLVLQNGNAVPSPHTLVMAMNEVPQVLKPVAEINTSRVVVQQPRIVEYASEKVVASNPYLPVASPGSSLTSTMFNAVPQSKGQFLRKIPIPPPTI
ncbi:unnamed protein product [Arctia plantaginis]|uniref:Uncharacterized protein n=1 Tax=Arctia plantaginis TaxID=874455 RepID=A0A8S1A8L4_ARCPL|nr:unnamed protein product [Arctia plantaginis]